MTTNELAIQVGQEAALELTDALGKIKHCVEEIVHMTRVILGDEYRIQWRPVTPEQGA